MKKTKVVLVTGGSRGIGKAIIQMFQSQHWSVAACSTTNEGVHASGADYGLICNVSEQTQVQAMIDSVMNKFGRLDAIINNAGLAGGGSWDLKENNESWHRILDVNLNGTYYVCKYALPYLPDHTGRIVNISSVLGLRGAANAAAYCAAKHGVVGLTKALAHDVASRHITVNAICPGWVRTDMASDRMREIGLSEMGLAKSVPLGRFIEPEEVADLAFYLVTSAAAANMTGQTLTLDGGVLA